MPEVTSVIDSGMVPAIFHVCIGLLELEASSTPWGPFIYYVSQKGVRGGISHCDDVYIKHTSVWDNV